MKIVTIGEIFKVSSGGTPSRKSPEYFDGGNIAWIKTGDLKGKYVGTPSEFITQHGLDNSSAKLFPANTVLLAMYGATIGACSILPFEASTNQACAALLPSEKCNETYLYYYLKSIKNSLIQMGVGGAQPNISAGLIKGVKIPLPPLEEQKQIAAILDAADSLRQKDQQMVEHYTALSQSLFLEMFGDPVSNPLGWEILCLGDLGNWQSGGTPDRKNADYFIGDIPWITSGELNNMYIKDSKEHISEIAIKNSAAKIIDKGSLLLGMYDTAALKSSITKEAVSCNQAIAFSKLDATKANTVFIYSMIQYGKEHYRRLQRGVRQQNLNLTMIKEIRVIHPPISLQNQFAERVAIIEQQKQQAQANLEKSKALFNSLAQRAFTGELTANKAA